MIKEFEGKTEKEAIDKAVAELGLERNEFDVEIMESSTKGFLFKKGTVRIKVHTQDGSSSAPVSDVNPEPIDEVEKYLRIFLLNMLEKMGFSANAFISGREDQKITFSIESEGSALLIGKQGKNLDAIQLLLNVYANKIAEDPLKVVVDIENYRMRKEAILVRLAKKTAEQVRRTKTSKLLEPMNPFERRLIHTALNDLEDIDTKSEGEGLYKQVRVIYRGQ